MARRRSNNNKQPPKITPAQLKAIAKLFGVSQKMSRTTHDLLWGVLLSHSSVIPRWLEVEAKLILPVPMSSVPRGPNGNRVRRLDSLFLCADRPDVNWQEASRKALRGKVGLKLLNVEAKKAASPTRDAPQLHDHKSGLVAMYGRLTRVIQRVLLTGNVRPRQKSALVDGGNEAGESRAKYIFIGDLHVDDPSISDEGCPFAAFAMLQLRGGDRMKYVLRALRLCGKEGRGISTEHVVWLFTMSCQLRPELTILVEQGMCQLEKEGKAMANGHEEGWNWDTPAMRRLTDTFVAHVGGGPERIPTVRRIIKQRDQEVRKAQEERRKAQEERRKAQEELRKARVDALVRLLRARSISLPSTIRNKLRRLSLSNLPPLRVAERAKDADEFARNAGLA